MEIIAATASSLTGLSPDQIKNSFSGFDESYGVSLRLLLDIEGKEKMLLIASVQKYKLGSESHCV